MMRSWLGVTIGRPDAGDRMLLALSMSTRASACASARQRHVDGHLVAVEVGVEGGADQRVDLQGLALDQHRLEGLDAEAVQRWCTVEEHRVLLDDVFEHVPHLRAATLDHALGALDVLRQLEVDEALHDERLEQLERHQLGQTALVQLQRGAGRR